MQRTVTSFSTLLSLVVFAFLMSGCGGAQEVRHTGGMTQQMQVGVSDELVTKITGLWQKIFGRDPTQDETQNAANFLNTSGNTEEMLRFSLANSAEAREKIRRLLSDAFGGEVNTGTVDLWIQALAERLSLSEIANLLGTSSE